MPYIFSATGNHNFKYGQLLPLVPLAMTNISLKILTASNSGKNYRRFRLQ